MYHKQSRFGGYWPGDPGDAMVPCDSTFISPPQTKNNNNFQLQTEIELIDII